MLNNPPPWYVQSFRVEHQNLSVEMKASDKMFASKWVSVKHRILKSKKCSEMKSILFQMLLILL